MQTDLQKNTQRPSRAGRRISATAFAAGLAAAMPLAAAPAADKSWDTQAGSWHSPGNWTPFGVPANTDNVWIGVHPAASNATVSADAPVRAASLTLTDGMQVVSDHASVILTGALVISGENIVGTTHYPSALLLDTVDGTSLSAASVQLADGGVLRLRNGSYANVSGLMEIDADSTLKGFGTLTLMGNGAISLINDGTIEPSSDGMTIWQMGTGQVDLDGVSGAGVVSLSTFNVATLNVADLKMNGTALSDVFNGHISMLMGAVLDMNLDEGWTAGPGSEIHAYTYDPMPAPARILGGAFTLGGTLWINGFSTSILDVEADMTVEPTALVRTDENALLRLKGATTVLDGEFHVDEDATIQFSGPTTLRGGLFEPPGIFGPGGEVEFMGPTTWDGSVVFEVAVAQRGDATVSGSTVIDADVLDMDGTGNTEWNINALLTINAQAIDATIGDKFDGTINMAGGFLGNLIVNLDNPNTAWTMAGELNLAPHALFVTRIAGSPLRITGDVNLGAGRAQITADAALMDAAAIDLPATASVLRFMGATAVFAGATFNGQGVLQNGQSGTMVLSDGVTLDEVGLVNEGRLVIGGGAGLVSVDRFTQTAAGTLKIEIGGYAAGTAHDQLLATGGTAQLAGTLAVDLIDLGDGTFLPALGDEFTILTALKGVSGTFLKNPTSCRDGLPFQWTVLYGSHTVTLRLEAIQSGLPGDVNCDCLVDFFDIDPFMLALLDPAVYEATYPNCPISRADVNGDGQVDLFDADPFVALLLLS